MKTHLETQILIYEEKTLTEWRLQRIHEDLDAEITIEYSANGKTGVTEESG